MISRYEIILVETILHLLTYCHRAKKMIKLNKNKKRYFIFSPIAPVQKENMKKKKYFIFSPIALVQTASLGSVVKRSVPPASKGQVVCAGEFFLLQIYSVTMFLACRGQHNR